MVEQTIITGQGSESETKNLKNQQQTEASSQQSDLPPSLQAQELLEATQKLKVSDPAQETLENCKRDKIEAHEESKEVSGIQPTSMVDDLPSSSIRWIGDEMPEKECPLCTEL